MGPILHESNRIHSVYLLQSTVTIYLISRYLWALVHWLEGTLGACSEPHRDRVKYGRVHYRIYV